MAPQARLRLEEQEALEARERVPRQPLVQRVLRREQVQQVLADPPASLGVRLALARRCAVREMCCFANLGCWGAWARRCDPSAERWNNTTATTSLKRGGQPVKPDVAQVLGATRQAAERDPGIQALLLRRVEERQLAGHRRAMLRARRAVARVLLPAILHQARQMRPARHQVRRVRERQLWRHRALQLRVVCLHFRVFQTHLRQ